MSGVLRYKITIEYNGTNYIGWQFQHNGKSIQEAIIISILKLTNNTINKNELNLIGAGRTDAGVHALGQVAHFNLNTEWDCSKLLNGINHYLKHNFDDIIVIKCEKVDSTFHARFSAKSRSYIYCIINRKIMSVLAKNLAWHVCEDLNVEKMNEAAQIFIGKHDFNSFRSAHCTAKSSIRSIDEIEVSIKNNIFMNFMMPFVTMYVRAPSFLHNQIRVMMGCLCDVGLGKLNIDDLYNILEVCDRKKASATAPAHGLYFLNVTY